MNLTSPAALLSKNAWLALLCLVLVFQDLAIQAPSQCTCG